MKEELISFKTAQLAKKKGFTIPVVSYYNTLGEHEFKAINVPNTKEGSLVANVIYDYNNHGHSNLYSAPTQSLLQRWLREKHKIELSVYRSMEMPSGKKYGCEVERWIDGNTEDLGNLYTFTYEEALEQGLIEALKMIP